MALCELAGGVPLCVADAHLSCGTTPLDSKKVREAQMKEILEQLEGLDVANTFFGGALAGVCSWEGRLELDSFVGWYVISKCRNTNNRKAAGVVEGFWASLEAATDPLLGKGGCRRLVARAWPGLTG